jgi:uncharacterized coiled-coil protein SlyX
MIRNITVTGRWRLPMAAALALISISPAHAFFWKQSEAPVTATPAPTGTLHSSVGNTAAELQRLMAAGSLSEMRTTYNGQYGASLLFHAESLNYYVALFHEKQFWRVIRTDQIENAEKVYTTFSEQTQQLAQVYLDTLRLDAGKRYTEKLVAMNENRLRGLEQEMAQQQVQAAAVSQSIADNRQQAVALSGDLKATNTQLEALQGQIRALQALQLDPSLSLPALSPAAASQTLHSQDQSQP